MPFLDLFRLPDPGSNAGFQVTRRTALSPCLGAEELPEPQGPYKAIPLDGKTLQVAIDGINVRSITFPSGSTTLDEVARLISEDPGLRAVAREGRIYLAGRLPGPTSSLEVLVSEAAALLGLEEEQTVYGFPSRVLLSSGERVAIADPEYRVGCRYRYRFTNESGSLVSALSAPFHPGADAPLETVLGTLRVIGGDGHPAVERVVTLYPTAQIHQNQVIDNTPKTYTTDRLGQISVPLLRGAVYVVVVDGTKILRRVTVPSDPQVSTFNLLDPAYSTDEDVWAVQSPELGDFYAKRSLT